MIISEQQARLATKYVEPPVGSPHGPGREIPPELMSRIILAVEATPEMTSELAAETRARLESSFPEPDAIAEMIIARAVCDALR